MDRKITLTKGEKLTISINRQNKDAPREISARSAGPAKGIIKSRRVNDYPKRRLQKGGLINFYDLGERLVSGSWTEDDRDITPTLADLNAYGISGIESHYLSSIISKMNLPLAVDKSDWKATFKKFTLDVTNPYYFRIITDQNENVVGSGIPPSYLDSDNANWTADGYKFTQLTDFRINQEARTDKSPTLPFYVLAPIFQGLGFDYSNAAYYKVTNLPNFSAAAVEFNLSPQSFDVFLNRHIYFIFDRQIVDGINIFIDVFLRSLTRARSTENAYAADGNPRRANIKMASHLPDARQFEQDSGTGAYSLSSSISDKFLDPVQDTELTVELRSGMLLGAFNQGAKWFFIWRS